MATKQLSIDQALKSEMRPRLTRRSVISATLVLLALVVGVGVALPDPAAAHHLPPHSTTYAWCFGSQDDWTLGRYVRVERPVVWAYDYRQAVKDTQYFAWQARLMKIVGGAAVDTGRRTGWSSPILTQDGDAGSVPFGRTGLDYIHGMNLYVPELGHEYQVWIDVYWYNSGTVPFAFSSTILPDMHLTQSGAGWFAGDPLGSNNPRVCDYIPDRGVIPMSL